jgi:hypothetical protein
MVVVLLIVGACLELGGLALVGWDVLDARRQVKNRSSLKWLDEHAKQQGLQATMAEVAAGNVGRRFLGAALFAAGVLVQTVANIAAL